MAALSRADRRRDTARQLASALGVGELIVFTLDPEVNALLPAPGFPQTLPGGLAWKSFLDGCRTHGSGTAHLAYPTWDGPQEACGWTGADGSVLVLLGAGAAAVDPGEVRTLLPLLSASFQMERVAATAAGQSAVARQAAAEARRLTEALDQSRREQARALADAEATRLRFERFMQHLPGLAWIKDREGHYLYGNTAFLKALHLRPEQVLQQDEWSVFATELATRLQMSDRRVLDGGTSTQDFADLPGADGAMRHYVITQFAIFTPAGRDKLVGGIAIDITELKRVQEELRQHAQRLTEADLRKDEFLAMLAHELRNPLAPILNALHIMKFGQADQTLVAEARDMAERQVQHLCRLVDDLMDVSRITRGKIQLRKVAVDVATVVDRAVESNRTVIQDQQHRLHVAMPPTPLSVHGDPTRLMQIISNLIHNAAKYTDAGGEIWVTAERDATFVRISVRDSGMGIPAPMLPHVFDLFTQVDRSLDRSHGGLGIGLTLVHRLVAMHDGEVSAHSAGENQGSEFTVRLPLMTPASPAEGDGIPETPKEDMQPRRILIVDDNVDAATSLAMLLRLLGNTVAVAHDGRSALETAHTFRPELAFLDIGLPEMDGFELARLVRQDPLLRHMVLIALTGYGQTEDRRRSQEAGFDRHLVKPIAVSELKALLAEPRPPPSSQRP